MTSDSYNRAMHDAASVSAAGQHRANEIAAIARLGELQGMAIQMAQPAAGADVDARLREMALGVIAWAREVERQLIDGDGADDFDGLHIE